MKTHLISRIVLCGLGPAVLIAQEEKSEQGKTIGVINDKPHWISVVAFSPDGKLMASSRGVGSTEVVVWDLATRKVIRVLSGTRGGIAALCFTPDGRKLIACDNSTQTVVWSLSAD